MIIKFNNGSSIDSVDSHSTVRGRRARIIPLCSEGNTPNLDKILNDVLAPFISRSEQTELFNEQQIYCSSKERNNMEEKESREYVFVSVDIVECMKELCDKFLQPCPEMNFHEQEAYSCGVKSVLSLLDQVCNETFAGEVTDDFDSILVHLPHILESTEFGTVEELQEVLNKFRLENH